MLFVYGIGLETYPPYERKKIGRFIVLHIDGLDYQFVDYY